MHQDFNSPARNPKITSRKSTITGLFFVTLTPSITPTDQEVDEALQVLGMATGACVCAYCGGKKSEWDHFRPIVLNRRPTGYITEIANLVPSCGKCNQSKGNKNWRDWMLSPTASHSPTKLKVTDIDTRILRLEAYEKWRTPTKINYETLLGSEQWEQHMRYLDEILDLMAKAESATHLLRAQIHEHLQRVDYVRR